MKNKKGQSLITIMIVIALAALGLRIAVEQVMKVNIVQNESGALATLKLISTALENYAKDHQGVFPSEISALTKTTPAYLNRDYSLQFPIKGYNYSCARLDATGYNCAAYPVICKMTGEKIYSITTGGSVSDEDCAKKE